MSRSHAAALGQGRVAAGQVDVSFVGDDGQDRREPLDQCWMRPFEAARPIDATRSKRGAKGFAGLWWFATTADHVGYESWLQRDHVMAWDFDPTVMALVSRPLRLTWQRDDKTVTHTPDFFARLRDGTAVVIEVRSQRRRGRGEQPMVEPIVYACQQVGWTVWRVDVMDPVRTANLRWLSGYRHPRCLDARWTASLLRVFAEGAALMDGARQVGDPIAVLPTLFHLLWRQLLHTDLDAAPIGAESLVHGGDI
ncbi:TnsA-like heteromeric transposase endonuclease subunit [Micromonospora sp. NPDC048986]|uniref:TnsA-like heteromeric transposase endonuclease subunit n=1 Tax=Micromonospora sp. NPDC048986 TaxID=3155644 RepID=UPI0034032FF1